MSSSVGLFLVLLAATGFSKAQSPSPVSTVYVTPVPSPAPPTCPKSDGTTYNGPSGSQFIVECGIDHFGGDMGSTHADTLEDCILACDSAPRCVDISLSGVACYLKSALGPPLARADIYGARRIIPTSTTTSVSTATSAPISCPNSNGTTFTTNTYARFEIGCGYESAGGDMGMSYVFNLEECVEKSCYLKSKIGASSISPSVSCARLTVERPQCPSPPNTTYIATNGKEFAIECDIDYPGGDIDSKNLASADGTGDSWFGQCIERCAANPDCGDISLSGSGCYLKGPPLRAASKALGIMGARWIDAPKSAPTPSPSASPTPWAVSPVDVGNFEYLACYNDSVGNRVLQGDFLYGTKNDTMTAEVCAEFCEDSVYFGLEYGQECYCANTLLNNPVQTPTACNMACTGNSTQLCGGPNALSLYRALNYTSSPPSKDTSPSPTQTSAGFYLTAIPFPISTASPNSTNSIGFSWARNSTTGFRFVRRQPRLRPVRLDLAYDPFPHNG